MKTSELTGAALDWAVAKAEGVDMSWDEVAEDFFMGVRHGLCFLKEFKPSTDWAQGGPIIEREEIGIQCCYTDGEFTGWMADSKRLNDDDDMEQYGPTPLVSAMRCFVAGKLGDEVDVPEELLA